MFWIWTKPGVPCPCGKVADPLLIILSLLLTEKNQELILLNFYCYFGPLLQLGASIVQDQKFLKRLIAKAHNRYWYWHKFKIKNNVKSKTYIFPNQTTTLDLELNAKIQLCFMTPDDSWLITLTISPNAHWAAGRTLWKNL